MTTPQSSAIRGRTLLPNVQGGMGAGISAHRLAGTVARAGAVGNIAASACNGWPRERTY